MAIGLSIDQERGRDMHERPRVMTQQTLDPQPLPDRALQDRDLSYVASTARQQGTIAAAAAGLVSGALVYGLTTLSPRFRSFTGISGKTALVVTPMFGAFTLKSHLAIANVGGIPQPRRIFYQRHSVLLPVSPVH
jgi:hypothetical protein